VPNVDLVRDDYSDGTAVARVSLTRRGQCGIRQWLLRVHRPEGPTALGAADRSRL